MPRQTKVKVDKKGKKRVKKKQPNSDSIIIACDTETQLRYDDSFISYQIEDKKRIEKELEINEGRGNITRQERKAKLKALDENWSKFIKVCRELGIETLPCNEIITYLLGWIELPSNHDIDNRKGFDNHKWALDNHTTHSDDLNYWDCPICIEHMVNDVHCIENLDYERNPRNVWRDFFDQLEAKYPKITLKGNRAKFRVYVHNLKFDARSLEFYFATHQDEFEDWQAINPQNTYYMISFTHNGHVYEFIDSFKMIAQSLGNASKLVNMRKTTEDATYTWFDVLNDVEKYEKEKSYLKYDVLILQHLLEFISVNLDITKLTSSSFAQDKLKEMIRKDDKKYGRGYFDKIYKTGITEEQDAYYRKAYSGGITIVQPDRENKEYNLIGFSFDVNSEYPASMLEDYPDPSTALNMTAKECYEHWSKHDWFSEHAIYRVYIHHLQLKKGMVAMYPKKTAKFAQTQAIVSLNDITSNGESIQWLTGIDLKNVILNYDIEFEFVDGVKFTGVLKKPFVSFVNYFKGMKEDAVRSGNKALKMVAKLCLNGVYGKFAERFHDTKTEFEAEEKNGSIEIKYNEVSNGKDYKQKGNIVIACFCTAKARNIIVTEAMKLVKDKRTDLIYIDTDSVHCNYTGKYEKILKEFARKIRAGEEYDKKRLAQLFIDVCLELEIKYDPAKFGYFKAEGFYDRSKYLGAKRYVEYDLMEGDNLKCAGLQAVGREFVLKRGIDYFQYSKDHIIVAPFVKLTKVYGGFKFVDSFKILSPQADKVSSIYI